MYERFTDRARKVMQLANQEAQRLYHEYIGTEHILLGIIKEGSGVAANVLKNMDIDLQKVRQEIEKIVQSGPETVTAGKLPQTPKAKKVIEHAIEEARNFNHNYVGTEHLLLGLVREGEGLAAQVLMNMGLKLEDVREEVLAILGHKDDWGASSSPGVKINKAKAKTRLLDRFGLDLTVLARQGKLDPAIGRQSEIDRVIQVLGRRSKTSPMLVGEPGVGKTAIVAALAQLIVRDSVPEILGDRRLLALDLKSILAACYKDRRPHNRMEDIVSEVIQAKNIILFVEEIGGLFDLEALGEVDFGRNVLRSAIVRHEIQCLATVTPDQYAALCKADEVLGWSFQPVHIKPASKDESLAMLRGLRSRFEAHHGVEFRDEALSAAAEFAARFFRSSSLPGAAVQIIDESGALVHQRILSRPPYQLELDAKIEQLNRQKEEAVAEQDFVTAVQLRDQVDKLRIEQAAAVSEWRENIKETDYFVDADVVAEAVARMTGLPRLWTHTKDQLGAFAQLEENLHRTVIGQPEAIAAIFRTLRRKWSRITEPKGPLASFMLVGPKGVGKTLLAGCLAETLFGDKETLVTINLASFATEDPSSIWTTLVPLLIGGAHTRPYRVFLLKEIDKGSLGVRNWLAQILDQGRLADKNGKTFDLSNSIFILTTSIGAEQITAKSGFGFGKKDEPADYEKLKNVLKQTLEASTLADVLTCLDDWIVFRSLGKAEIKNILDLQLANLVERIKAKGMNLEVTQEARDFLLGSGFIADQGARPLMRALAHLLEAPLADELLKGSFQGKGTITARVHEVDREKRISLVCI